MRASVALIDKARTLCQPPTYYRLAKKLEIGHQTLSRVRNRGGTLDNEAATRLAELLGQPPMDVIAIMESERAKTPEKKAFWERRLPRFVPVVASLGIITGVTYVAIFGSNLSNYLYIMRRGLYIRTGCLETASARFSTWFAAAVRQLGGRSSACRGFVPQF